MAAWIGSEFSSRYLTNLRLVSICSWVSVGLNVKTITPWAAYPGSPFFLYGCSDIDCCLKPTLTSSTAGRNLSTSRFSPAGKSSGRLGCEAAALAASIISFLIVFRTLFRRSGGSPNILKAPVDSILNLSASPISLNISISFGPCGYLSLTSLSSMVE